MEEIFDIAYAWRRLAVKTFMTNRSIGFSTSILHYDYD
jgi:hypothetical protein